MLSAEIVSMQIFPPQRASPLKVVALDDSARYDVPDVTAWMWIPHRPQRAANRLRGCEAADEKWKALVVVLVVVVVGVPHEPAPGTSQIIKVPRVFLSLTLVFSRTDNINVMVSFPTHVGQLYRHSWEFLIPCQFMESFFFFWHHAQSKPTCVFGPKKWFQTI